MTGIIMQLLSFGQRNGMQKWIVPNVKFRLAEKFPGKSKYCLHL